MSDLAKLPEAIVLLSGSPTVVAAWLGGSYAVGTATHLSDVDIAVLVRPTPPGCSGVVPEVGQVEELDALDGALRTLFAPVRCSPIRLYPTGTIDPRTPRLLARSVTLVHRDRVAAEAYWQRLFPAGVPAPEEVEQGTWQSRTAFTRRMAEWAQMDLDDVLAPLPESRHLLALRMGVRHVVLGAGAAANLGHQVIKLLGLPVPDIRQRIPAALHAAGVVSGDTAGYLQDLLSRFRDSNLHQEGEAGPLRDSEWEAVLRGAGRLRDWADCCCHALEQAAAAGQIAWRRPSTLGELLGQPVISGRRQP